MALNSLFCADVPLSNYSLTGKVGFHKTMSRVCRLFHPMGGRSPMLHWNLRRGESARILVSLLSSSLSLR